MSKGLAESRSFQSESVRNRWSCLVPAPRLARINGYAHPHSEAAPLSRSHGVRQRHHGNHARGILAPWKRLRSGRRERTAASFSRSISGKFRAVRSRVSLIDEQRLASSISRAWRGFATAGFAIGVRALLGFAGSFGHGVLRSAGATKAKVLARVQMATQVVRIIGRLFYVGKTCYDRTRGAAIYCERNFRFSVDVGGSQRLAG